MSLQLEIVQPYDITSHRQYFGVFEVFRTAFNFKPAVTPAAFFRVVADAHFVVATEHNIDVPVGVGIVDTTSWQQHGTIGSETRANLVQLGVLTGKEHTGIGSFVLAGCEDLAQTTGMQHMTVTPNKGREDFYNKRGYEPTPECSEEFIKRLA